MVTYAPTGASSNRRRLTGQPRGFRTGSGGGFPGGPGGNPPVPPTGWTPARAGERSLEEILGTVGEEGRRTREQLPGLEEEIRQRAGEEFDFSSVMDPLQSVASGTMEQISRPGGALEQAERQALGGSIEEGFGTASGSVTRGMTNAFERAGQQVSNKVAQAAPQVYQTGVQREMGQLGALQDLHSLQAQRADQLLSGEFGGRATIRQLEEIALPESRAKLDRLDDLEGGDLGSAIGGMFSGGLGGFAMGGPIGAGVGAAGGFLSGIL